MPLFIRPERHAAGDVPHKPRERLSGTQIRLLLGLYAGYSSMMFSRASKSGCGGCVAHSRGCVHIPKHA